ncbi:MAG: VWA domain-containing protein [Mariprofundaceae bacterium]
MLKSIYRFIWVVALLLPFSAFAANPAVLFVFDGSGSMWGKVDGKPKVVLAKGAISELVKGFPAGTDMGLVAYGHRKEGDCGDIEMLAAVGSSKDAVIHAINSINPKGKTPLTKSIQFAADKLNGRDAPTSIVVISDGKESCNADPCAAAKAVREAGVNLKVHVIGFDVKGDEAKQLQCIASNGGGKYFAANNAGDLAKSFAEVKKEVAEVKKPEPTSKVIFRDDFNDEFLSDQWEIKNPNEEGMIVEDGSLQIITEVAKESFFNPTNFVLLKQTLPRQYEVILKMRYTRTDASNYNWRDVQTAGLFLFKNEQNAIVLAASNKAGVDNNYWHDAIQYSKMSKNKWMPGHTSKLDGAKKEREITLRIQHIKRKFIASYLDPKGEWQTVGEYTQLRAKYKVGIYASRGSKAHEEMEIFDAFTLKEIK